MAGHRQLQRVGWALGIERLVQEAAAAANPDGAAFRLTATPVPDLYLVNRGEQAETLALALARQLRAAGVSVELDGSGAAFGKQFKRADRSGGHPADHHLGRFLL